MTLDRLEVACGGAVVAAAAILIVLERTIPQRRGQRLLRTGFVTDLAMYSLAQSYLVGLLVAALLARLPSGELGWPVTTQVAFFLVLHDFNLYWFHRWQHRWPLLWRTHEVHHSNTELDWVAGSRATPWEILITEVMKYAPLVILGARPEVAVVKGTIDAIWGMYIHSNVDVPAGVLRYVINGPAMHRWHHAVDVQDKNFATKLALWDWLFGTAHLPADRSPSAFGLPGGGVPSGYWRQQLSVFRARRRPAKDAAPSRAASA